MTEQITYVLLIADDDEEQRLTLRDIFERTGYRTVLAANGREAIDILDDHVVDCLLLDVHMPLLSGMETLEIIRREKGSLPAIMLTADCDQSVMRRALSLSAFTVLNKPVGRELVTRTVRRALQHKSRSA